MYNSQIHPTHNGSAYALYQRLWWVLSLLIPRPKGLNNFPAHQSFHQTSDELFLSPTSLVSNFWDNRVRGPQLDQEEVEILPLFMKSFLDQAGS